MTVKTHLLLQRQGFKLEPKPPVASYIIIPNNDQNLLVASYITVPYDDLSGRDRDKSSICASTRKG